MNKRQFTHLLWMMAICLLCVACSENDDEVKTGTSFLTFSLGASKNAVIGDNTITIQLPYSTTQLSSLIATFTTDGEKVYVGETEQKSGKTLNDFSSPVTYRVVSSLGEERTYVVSVFYSALPLVSITTKNNAPITSKDDWVKGSKMLITNTGGKYDIEYEGISIKGRGNSTWNYPKKPYAIKLDKKAEVLGMPKHKRWVLLANWMDRTLLRNAVAFEIARNTESLEWTPRGEFVEVILNGKFLGNYYLCEQIKIDENRVNVAELESTNMEGEAITGGYLLELDTYFDEVNKFRSLYGKDSDGNIGMPVNIKEPDEDVLVPAQLEYIKNYFCTAESLLYADDFPNNTPYKDYIDLESFIDWWFVYELTINGEPNHPKSSYMNKDRNGKLKAGPVWDFDWGTFKPGAASFRAKDAIWYKRLFLDPEFVSLVKKKWAASKDKFTAVGNFIDSTTALIKPSAEANSLQWPISSDVNGDEKMDFDEAVALMKSVYLQRIEWLDKAINGL